MVSRSSHLPHVVAAALANLVLDPRHSKNQPALCANGFRDTTRIAAGDPELWTAIFAQNREAVLSALGGFDGQLALLRSYLESSDWPALLDALAQAKKVRDALGS